MLFKIIQTRRQDREWIETFIKRMTIVLFKIENQSIKKIANCGYKIETIM